MDTLKLVPHRLKLDGTGWEYADVAVNEVNLVEILREIEMSYAEAEGDPGLAGRYGGLSSSLAFFPSRYYLGERPRFAVFGEYPPGKLPILGCNCLETECWPFLARIAVHEESVVWSDFENYFRGPHSPEEGRPVWSYERLGRFVFNRHAYEAMLGSHAPAVPRKFTFEERRKRRHEKQTATRKS
jgi:hypothetical protein